MPSAWLPPFADETRAGSVSAPAGNPVRNAGLIPKNVNIFRLSMILYLLKFE
jgi:hypothetical protein